ncbi:MAG: DNA methyltransferase, partial [Proteobacteria bacterium]|nr:DNA methyltransferase [Pseudomonadota bacterium]
SLSEESHLAGKVKKEQPILVIMGNPPYSYHSLNTGKWISEEIRAYYHIDGKPLGEKNPKGLQDDYVKFIRFAQWKIDKAGEGVLGFITNHGYLDNPTFRGMRQSLMASFNEMYLLDLHGNSLKKEKCPDGSKDENVFDIMQGVAIAIFVKIKGERTECKVHHSEIWGLREVKYNWLLKNDIKTTKWNKLSPKSEFYLFISRDEKLLEGYKKYPKITEIFPVNGVGIATARDDFVIDPDKEALKRRIRMFCDEKIPDELIRDTFHLRDKQNWRLKKARERVRQDKDWENAITRILYRPFDVQWVFYNEDLIERSRKEVMRHMIHENLGLISNRQVNREFRHVFCSNIIINDCTISLETRERSYLFPLYLYPETDKPTTPKKRSLGAMAMLFEPSGEYTAKKSNLNPVIVEQLAMDFGKSPTPEEIFYYIYAILYSNTYRTMYAEFLKIDFPRIPFTKDYGLFRRMAEYGQRLVELHLLNAPELDPPLSKCQGKGDFKVEKVKYYENEGLPAL